MSLILVPIIKDRNDTVSYTLLLSSNKVEDFYQDSSGHTVFQYWDTGGRRYKSKKYTSSLSKAAFHARVREAANEQWINIQYIEWDRKSYPSGRIFRMNVEHLVKGVNVSINGVSGYSYIWIERGSHEPHIRLLTTHTIEDISRSSSRSASLSPS